jgi:serine/threonine protein kinase
MGKTRKSNRRGGAMLGYGTYGAVFDPPLVCKDGSGHPGQPGDKYVSKAVFLKDPTIPHKEMRFARLLKERLGDKFLHSNTILPEKQCAVDPELYIKSVTEMETSVNKNILMKRTPNTLLFLKKADGALGDLYEKIGTIKDSATLDLFLKSMNMNSLPEFKTKMSKAFDRLRQAVKQLHNAGILHHDIGRGEPQIFENVLYVLENNDIQFKLIDFGIAKVKVRFWEVKPFWKFKRDEENDNPENYRHDKPDYMIGDDVFDEEEFKLFRETELEDVTNIKKEFIDFLNEHTEKFMQTNVKCSDGMCTVMGGKRKTRKTRRTRRTRG